ncbi:MAG: DNA cytosine methyltransferase, partial [Candidatus Eutrophobiaceae bacterium]
MKSVDLFAGAGGLSCGLEMAGFQPVLANELV